MKRLFIFVVLFSSFTSVSASAQILVEAFRNVNCLNCKVPDVAYEDFLKKNPDLKVNLVYFHNYITNSQDPFFLAAKDDILARNDDYYNIQQDPFVFVSGINAGSTESKWEQFTKAAPQYPAALTATASSVGGIINIDIHVEGSVPGKSVKPFVMLVESGIFFANTFAYGNPHVNPPDSLWDNVFRAMIPQKDGGEAFIINGAKDLHFTFDASGKPFNLDNCKIIAILQAVNATTGNSHEVLGLGEAQITKAAVVGANHDLSSSLNAPIPNPSHSFAKIPFHLAAPANVKIVICDDLGREVATILNKFVSETESSAIFAPNNLSGGMYYARMYADGAFIGMQKIVFVP